MDNITIDVDEKDEHYVFYCNRWLGSSDIAVEFTPGNAASVLNIRKLPNSLFWALRHDLVI